MTPGGSNFQFLVACMGEMNASKCRCEILLLQSFVMAIFDVSLGDYLSTTSGLFNFLEIIGGLVLFGLMAAIKENTALNIFLFSVSYAFSFNGAHIMICSLFSLHTMKILMRVFYFVFYQMVASLAYVGGSVKLIKESPSVPVHAVVGIITGGIHTLHFLVVVYHTYL
ncbi:uncharacterized protein LOC144149609 [Haemaphysalis longicornis]